MLPAKSASPPVHTTALRGLRKIHTGKVRDIYEIDAHSMLIVTTDRLSAFDVVLPDPIPDKGRVLNSISNFWFDRTKHIVPNHLTGRALSEVISDPDELALLADRAVIVKRLKTVPLEAVVRGYVIGSGWKDYQKSGSISGIKLPAGMKQAGRLPQTLFTPSTKAAIGHKDETISFEQAAGLVGNDIAARVRATAIALHEFAALMRERGIIIADTKFSSRAGRRQTRGRREVLTPDSSRLSTGLIASASPPPSTGSSCAMSRDARLEQAARTEAPAGGHRGHAGLGAGVLRRRGSTQVPGWWISARPSVSAAGRAYDRGLICGAHRAPARHSSQRVPPFRAEFVPMTKMRRGRRGTSADRR
jgi:phosphoribosylaminoimidazole-succinocarboxamide synthase